MKINYGQVKMQFLLKNRETEKLPFYIMNIGSMENQHPCYRPEGLMDYQFLYCSAGEGYLNIEGVEYTISAGMGMYFRPNVVHDYYATKEPWTTHWILFNGSAVDLVPCIQEMGRSLVFHIYAMDKLSLLHEKVYTSAKLNSLLNINEVSAELYHFLLEIPSCITSTALNKQDSRMQQLTKVITYIESNYAQDITLNELSDLAGITPQHLCRLFKQVYHMRPIEYLVSYRMKQAKILLTGQKKLTLKEIALYVGFHDLSYFCKIFKKLEGVTPMDFKKMH